MLRFLIPLAAVICFGCQSNPTLPKDLPEAVPTEAVEYARQEFLESEDFSANLMRLLELEQQALQLAADEPLKLGSIGSAILDIYYGSHTGHFVMGLFYDHVESAEAKEPHAAWLEKLQTLMQRDADGSRERPFPVMTIYDAHTYARTQGLSSVGSIYQSTDDTPFGALVLARKGDDPVVSTFFEMADILQSVEAEDGQGQTPWPLVRDLAAQMDTAAQTAIGAFLINGRNLDAAVSWLRVASRSGNMLANSLLARIYWTQAEQAEEETIKREKRELSLENHLHAVALGSTESMYTLAHLYLEGHFGEGNDAAAVALLQQAGGLGHADSLLYLGHLYNAGQGVEQDISQANTYFQKAASMNDAQAIISYGRFLMTSASAGVATGEILDWLTSLADAGQPEAMVVLGNLYARGVGAKQSTNRAVRWYKKAVKSASQNGDIVNEVAWTLTVSDVNGLKRARYARRIMDALMKSNERARLRPEYLDTWAATYAASGDFNEALNLQEQAIAAATNQERDDVMDILKEHLELFRAGTTITERAP